MNTLNQSREANKQNVSLSDLLRLLWRSKKIIFGITLLCACISIAYIALVSPTYQATVKILPPQDSDLAEYSEILNIIDTGVSDKETQRRLNADQAYEILYTHLKSDSVKNQFLTQFYLPYFDPKNEDETETVTQRLDKSLKINGVASEGGTITLSIQSKDPKIAAKWANDYLALAIASSHAELLKNLQSEIAVKKQSTQSQISTLRKLEHELQNLKIDHLQNALTVAKAMGLEDPMPGSTVITLGNSSNNIANESSYLRGTKSLQAEIEVLNRNKNQDAYINGLPKLLTQQALLQALDTSPAFSVARIDMPAHPPYEPIKPIKPLILLMGIIFGLFLGVFFVLIANAIRNE